MRVCGEFSFGRIANMVSAAISAVLETIALLGDLPNTGFLGVADIVSIIATRLTLAAIARIIRTSLYQGSSVIYRVAKTVAVS